MPAARAGRGGRAGRGVRRPPTTSVVVVSSRAGEDGAELHAAAACRMSSLVSSLAPPPQRVAKTPRQKLQHLDGVPCELKLDGLESGCGGSGGQGLRVVAPKVSHATVVATVRTAKGPRDMLERMRNGHPGEAARPKHSCELPPSRCVVGNVLEDRDRERRSER